MRAARFAELDRAIAAEPREMPRLPRFNGEVPLLRRERIALEREMGMRPQPKQSRYVLPAQERRLKYLLELGRLDQIRDEGLWLLPGAQQIGELVR